MDEKNQVCANGSKKPQFTTFSFGFSTIYKTAQHELSVGKRLLNRWRVIKGLQKGCHLLWGKPLKGETSDNQALRVI